MILLIKNLLSQTITFISNIWNNLKSKPLNDDIDFILDDLFLAQVQESKHDAPIEVPLVNRVEVIDSSGRAYVKYLDTAETVEYQYQDDGKTLKLFIK